MKNLKYLLFSLFLILSFNINVSAGISNTNYGYDVTLRDHNNNIVYSTWEEPVYNYWVAPTDVEPRIKATIKIYGNVENLIEHNPKSKTFYVVFNVCTTEPPTWGGVLTQYVDFTGQLDLFKVYSNKFNTSCVIEGYQGQNRTTSLVIKATNSIRDVDGDFYYSLGSFTLWGGAPAVYSFLSIQSFFIFPVDDTPAQEQLVDDTRSIWEKIATLPTDIWNKMSSSFSSMISYLSGLPSSIWSAISTGFNWIVDALDDVGDFIISLPSKIWTAIKTGFQWIVDGVTNLLNFFNNDDDVDVNGLSSIGLLPAGPVDSILNLPFTFLNNLNTNLNNQCQAVNIPLPYVDRNLPLPCVNTVFTQISGLSVFISGLSVILASFILFKYLINLYKWVDKTLSLKDNNHLDNWGGL